MSWDPALSTGIDLVDFQHMKLVEKVEELLDACEHHAEEERINSMLNFLESYVVQHFGDEEKLQKESNYPKYESHKHMHEYFVADFLELKDKIDEEGISEDVMNTLNSFLLQWVIAHVSGADMEFAKHYKAVNPSMDFA
jgi:hemerythrin